MDKKIKKGQKKIVLPPNILGRVCDNPLIKNLYLTAIGFYPKANYHNCERKNGCNEYILLYCTQGEGFVKIKDKKLHLTPNHFIIIKPQEPHHYKSSLKNPWSVFWVHFSGPNSHLLYLRYTEINTQELRQVPYSENRISTFLQTIELLEDNLCSENLEIANSNLLYFLTFMIYDYEKSSSFFQTDPVKESINYMKKNIDKFLKIDELAKHQNLSVSRYSERFKEKTGYSPIQYYVQLKIQKSCQLLYFSDLSIKEICQQVGFSDPYYFSRVFKKLMGIAPSQYKATYKN